MLKGQGPFKVGDRIKVHFVFTRDKGLHIKDVYIEGTLCLSSLTNGRSDNGAK